MRMALVHDWFAVQGGSERVVEQILRILPVEAVYALFDVADSREFLQGHAVHTSFLQRLPFVRTQYRHYLPLMPLAIEQFDLSSYDLVISSSHAVAKGVLTRCDQLHISYVHTPVRYAWDLQHQYLELHGKKRGLSSLFIRAMLHYLRL